MLLNSQNEWPGVQREPVPVENTAAELSQHGPVPFLMRWLGATHPLVAGGRGKDEPLKTRLIEPSFASEQQRSGPSGLQPERSADTKFHRDWRLSAVVT